MGHSHEVFAAAPEELAGGVEPRPRAAFGRSLALGALVGAACGAAEVAWRMHVDLDPSVARRAAALVLGAALFYGLAGGLLTAALTPLSRLLDVRYAARFQRVLAGLACLVLGVASCAAALASGTREPPAGPLAEPPAQARNLVLIVVDTLRADALGTYGAPRPTPHVDALAAGGAVFEEVVAPSSWTLPAMASLFTSTYPARHGYVDFDGRLDSGRVLAEVLAAAGWECRAVVGNTLLDPARGFARGFALYDAYDFELERNLWLNQLASRVLRAGGRHASRKRVLVPVLTSRFPFVDTRLTFYNLDEDVTARVLRHALPAPAERPLFLFVHYLAPHTPYLAHPLTITKRAPQPGEVPDEELRALYLDEVAYTDGEVGRLLARLESEGLLENAVVCLTADHGEAFAEHEHYEHGRDLHREAVRVPWILAGPGIPPGARWAPPVSLVDLAPTLLELLGVPAQPGFDGRSLLPALRGAGPASAPVFAETSSRFLTPDAHHRAAFAGTLRLLRTSDAQGELVSEQLFDGQADPGERQPLADHPGLGALRAALADYVEGAAEQSDPAGAVDLERMRALGYTDAERGDGGR